jgi:RNase P/RNase MRP subunit p29
MNEPIESILHKHMIPFELHITELGIRGRINFEEAMILAMKEYAEQEKQILKDALKNKVERL